MTSKQEHLDKILQECLDEIPLTKTFERDLVMILSDDEWSVKQYSLLSKEDVLDKFEITYSVDWVKDLKVTGFPTFYCRSTKKMCTGFDNYSTILSKVKFE